MKSMNLGIVGLGYWGPNYARIINEIDGANLSWCCDINQSALSKFSILYPHVKTTLKIQDLLDDHSLDAVIVVTPAQTHYEIARKFILSGKDVLVEKPLTNNLSNAKKLTRLAKNQKKILMVDHTFIFNAAILKLKKLIKNQSFGKIYYIYGNYNALGPIRKDVSVLWDLPHFIYVVNFLLGSMPSCVNAFGKNYLQQNMEDVVFLNFEYPNNILVNINCSWIDPVKVRQLTVVGQKKMAVFNDMESENKLTIYNKRDDAKIDYNFTNLQLIIRKGNTFIPKLEIREPLKEVVKSFVKVISKGNIENSNHENGFELIKILTAAQQSLDERGRKILIKNE